MKIAVLIATLLGSSLSSVAAVQAPEPGQFVYVTGFVERPGKYAFEPSMTVEIVIQKAEGVRPGGDTDTIQIRRMVDRKLVVVDASLATPVQAGDNVHVPRVRAK